MSLYSFGYLSIRFEMLCVQYDLAHPSSERHSTLVALDSSPVGVGHPSEQNHRIETNGRESVSHTDRTDE